MESSEFQETTTTKLTRIAQLSQRDPSKQFHCLMHHYNVDSLRVCFQELDGKRALGNDGISKEDYGVHLEENLTNVVQHMKSMSYRPKPVRQVLIPKEGKPGVTRPLGISNFEDKLIQKMTKKILESIYELLHMNHFFWIVPLGSGRIKVVIMLFRHWVITFSTMKFKPLLIWIYPTSLVLLIMK